MHPTAAAATAPTDEPTKTEVGRIRGYVRDLRQLVPVHWKRPRDEGEAS